MTDSKGSVLVCAQAGIWVTIYRSPFFYKIRVFLKTYRTICYVDGFNLYNRRLKKSKYKWLDLRKLAEEILPQPQYSLEEVKYFTSRLFNKKNRPLPPNAIRQETLLKALDNIATIELGIFLPNEKRGKVQSLVLNKKSEVTCEPSDIKLARIKVFEEKQTDVKIAIHITQDSMKKDIDCVALISNDTDFVPALTFARDVQNKRTIVISPDLKSPHRYLRKACNSYMTFPNEKLESSLLPDEVKLPTGEIVEKPTCW